jgi:NADPH:quinone reductase-like Zn-dependent oxidoreductase
VRAFAVDSFGAKGSVHEVPIPEPGEGEVLVRVHAAGVNVMDPIFTGGYIKDYMEHRFPLVPGIDLSGLFESIGPGVTTFAVGDEVFGVSAKPFVGEGTFAEYVAAPASGLARKPAGLSHAEAASLPHAALTALAAVDAADPQPRQVILLVGAAGGVGTIASQLASQRGARVVAVTSAASAEHARSYGAAETADYSSGDVVEQIKASHPDGVDGVIDLHSDADEFARYASLVRKGGVAVTTRGPAGAAAPEIEMRGVRFASANRAAPERLAEISEAVDAGRLRVPPLKTFRLEQAPEAMAEIANGHVRGKLVIEVE